MDYFFKKIGILELLYGTGITARMETSTLWLSEKLKSADILFYPASEILIGKFYFMFYAMKEKNPLENIAAVMIIGKQKFDTDVYYGLNFNYLPIELRERFFNELFKGLNTKFYNDESKNNVLSEAPLDITFSGVYNILKGIGFEWAIREILPIAIEECYVISFQELNKFCNINLQQLTGMTDEALAEIAMKKFKNQSKREQDLIFKIKNKQLSSNTEKIYKMYK